jgi:hypothetical protein
MGQAERSGGFLQPWYAEVEVAGQRRDAVHELE